MQCCYKNDNKVDKKAYSFYVEPSNEEDTIMYLYIQSFHVTVLIKKKPPFKIFQFVMNAYINFSISIDKRFSVKKMDINKGLNSENLSRWRIFLNPMQTRQ